MSRGKSTYRVSFPDVVPKMMEIIGAIRNKQLAEDLGINPQSISNFKKKGTFPIGLITEFCLKHSIPMEKLIMEKTADYGSGHEGDSKERLRFIDMGPSDVGTKRTGFTKADEIKMADKQTLARSEEDVYYSQILSAREHGPEFVEGRQILKLYLLKQVFGGEYDLSKMKFLVQTEVNFAPQIFPGNILIIDMEDRKIASAFYILSYGPDSYALRKLDPINQDTVRVVSGTTVTSESRDMPTSLVKNLIVGRVVLLISKI
jgi:Bacteriophage CI repressor helix-turn-helix domain